MAKVTGIGGFFFRARDPKMLTAWYQTHLGVDDIATAVWTQQAGPTVFAPFSHDTDYFGRPEQQWMINFPRRRSGRHDGHAEGRRHRSRDARRVDSQVGRFCRIHDPEGNPIELWEPAAA